jgi:hypothetical protein
MKVLTNLAKVSKLCFLFLLSCGFSSSFADDLAREIEGAKQGSKVDLYSLGVRYDRGDGVRMDLDLSVKFYLEAARKNYAPAQNNLGWAYRQGLGVPKNTSRAIFWFRLAALQGNALALQNLAEMYQAGEGIKKDTEVAEKLFTLCAVQPITDDDISRESGFNTAIAECRKEVGKITFSRPGEKQERLIRAAFWYTLSLVENEEMTYDSEEGVRARRAKRDTQQVLRQIEAELTNDSIDTLIKRIREWEIIRETIADRTDFPLIEIECHNGKTKI